MSTINLNYLQSLKGKQIFSCLTAYDASMARVISAQKIEVILIGDSLGMVIQGHATTVPVRIADMVYHTNCVRRGNLGSFLMADMPFACHHNTDTAVQAAAQLMRAGAQCVKIEGGAWIAGTIARMRDCGIPVCAHLGLCPQSVHVYGGYKKQGLNPDAAETIYKDAIALEKSGAGLMLLESVPAALTQKIVGKLSIPVIGIGAGSADAQVLVLQDVLGITEHPPTFAKNFILGQAGISEAVAAYGKAVRNGEFPSS